jgi:hypothetical protein
MLHTQPQPQPVVILYLPSKQRQAEQQTCVQHVTGSPLLPKLHLPVTEPIDAYTSSHW